MSEIKPNELKHRFARWQNIATNLYLYSLLHLYTRKYVPDFCSVWLARRRNLSNDHTYIYSLYIFLSFFKQVCHRIEIKYIKDILKKPSKKINNEKLLYARYVTFIEFLVSEDTLRRNNFFTSLKKILF